LKRGIGADSTRNPNPEKISRAQGGARVDLAATNVEASVQERADRVLSRIRGKLGHDLSVEYTVNQLIQQARDTENLAKIYQGKSLLIVIRNLEGADIRE
jgi:hypothetical protein